MNIKKKMGRPVGSKTKNFGRGKSAGWARRHRSGLTEEVEREAMRNLSEGVDEGWRDFFKRRGLPLPEVDNYSVVS